MGAGDDGFSVYWIRDFERRCPDVVTARNMLEHFDEYAIGGGRLQKGSRQEPLRVGLERLDSAGLVLTLRTTGSVLRIALDETTAEGGELMVGLMMARDQSDENAEEADAGTEAVEARRKAGIPSVRTRPTQKTVRPGR